MDLRELMAFLDERFRENARETARLIDERFQENARQMDERFQKTSQEIASFREETNGRFERMDGRFERMDGRFERVEESVRHTQIQVEGLRGDTRLLAEKIGTFDDKIESVRSELKEEIGGVKSLLLHSYGELDRRIGKRASGKRRP